MHDILRRRVIRKLEVLPDERVYQVLDYIEFLESRYGRGEAEAPSGLQRFAERLEDRLRRKRLRPGTIRSAVGVIATADRVVAGVAREVARAGRELVGEVESAAGRGSRGSGGAGTESGG